MRLSPRTLDLFLIHPAEMPRRRPGRTAAGTALAAVAAFSLFGAESAGAGSETTLPTRPSSAYRTTSETSCASGDLRAELTGAQHGAGQTHAELVLVNMSGRSCTVAGHPAVFRVDAAGRRLGAPAAADGPDGSPVLLAAGGRAVAGLTLSAAGLFPGCGDGGPVADVADLQVIPPGGRRALPVAGFADVLPTDWSAQGGRNPASGGSSTLADTSGGAPDAGPDRGCAEPEPTMMRVTALAAG
ncbi:hypothetical protein CC117_01860 [Parafrankia colletiae]|uniref:DUF4232 domain-containing protein n=1 Tax=Parafrankia colletiae TaxID=573497 RepID=A0A1S1RNN6_9ACTN|nr:DUF4232 domain-containing protein [Parafrankia colletiae]MCK9904565.1 DUF4232 domain-containing protein [Frankia sp. Cpl3]OHV46404.1 hypothetical protein CC117_01860 [Parafrankia colletiae]